MNDFGTYLHQDTEEPRLKVLQNFKEINRMMTNIYLKQKELKAKYGKSVIP